MTTLVYKKKEESSIEQFPHHQSYGRLSCQKTFFNECVPIKYKNASIADYEDENFIKFADRWSENPFSLFLVGGYGTGKTHYAFALIRQVFRKTDGYFWARYFTSPQLDGMLLNAVKSEEGDSYLMQCIASEKLLFIDDLGRETKSDRLKRQYFEIFNERYCNNLPTIITSNYTLDKLGDIIDGSIVSRMQEWKTIEFRGPDRRKNGGAHP